jgi:hypothetical protein
MQAGFAAREKVKLYSFLYFRSLITIMKIYFLVILIFHFQNTVAPQNQNLTAFAQYSGANFQSGIEDEEW